MCLFVWPHDSCSMHLMAMTPFCRCFAAEAGWVQVDFSRGKISCQIEWLIDVDSVTHPKIPWCQVLDIWYILIVPDGAFSDDVGCNTAMLRDCGFWLRVLVACIGLAPPLNQPGWYMFSSQTSCRMLMDVVGVLRAQCARSQANMHWARCFSLDDSQSRETQKIQDGFPWFPHMKTYENDQELGWLK